MSPVRIGLIEISLPNEPMRARSCGSMASMNLSVDSRTSSTRDIMLPLMSSMSATVIGCTSLENVVTSTGLPLSSTENLSRVRSGTSRPLASCTVAWIATVCTLVRKAG